MRSNPSLSFIELKLDSCLNACKEISSGKKIRCHLKPFNEMGVELVKKAAAISVGLDFYVDEIRDQDDLPKSIYVKPENQEMDIVLLLDNNSQFISQQLLEYIDKPFVHIIAPKTDSYYRNLPLFLISIPKSGTHLLYSLVEHFGYNKGVVCPEKPNGGHWYCVEYSNSHTSAKDFFIDTVRRSPFGNRDHPFLNSPAIFMYRNPLDIVVSEANYYHKDAKTAFYGYLSNRSFEDRLRTLINDPWLLGSIRDRIGQYIPWLSFPNVIPISFEELIGPQGGGRQDAQIQLIWSLQLKLHVPGSPHTYGEKIFNPNSPTFNEGQIGNFKKQFTPDALRNFYALPQDFMELMGYSEKVNTASDGMPARAEEFRKRHLWFSQSNFDTTPINVEYDYLGFNIVKYRSSYYCIRVGSRPIDLTRLKVSELKKMSSENSLEAAKQKILLHRKSERSRKIAKGLLKRIKEKLPDKLIKKL
jgi:hypothetical protein